MTMTVHIYKLIVDSNEVNVLSVMYGITNTVSMNGFDSKFRILIGIP